MKSWKTTLGGIAAILVGLGMLGSVINDFLNGKAVDMEQLMIAVSGIGAGITGLSARDNGVSSQDVGLRPE